MRRVLAPLLTALMLPAAVHAATHPPTIDDIMRLRIITAIEPSPVGTAVVLQTRDYDGGDKWQKDLWLVRPGQAPRRLTTGGVTGGSFAFAPDGTRIAFAGERAGKSGIHVLPVDGGEPSLLAELPVDADNLRWVGQRLFFSAAVYPDCGADLACTKKRDEDKAAGPSAHVYDDLYFRPWNDWSTGKHSNLFAIDVSTTKVEPVVTGLFDCPRVPFGGREDYAVSPDGQVVAYTAKKALDKARSTNDDLFLIEGGKTIPITDNPAADRNPVFSPDGRRIAYLAQAVPGFESDRVRLMVYDRDARTHTPLAADLDAWVDEVVWAPDGKSLYFTTELQGRMMLHQVEARAGASARVLARNSTDNHPALSGDRKSLYFLRQSLTMPPELFARDLKTGQEAPITRMNADALAGWAMPTVEEVWYDGAPVNGKPQKVHAFVMRPHGAAGRLPMVVMVHGGPQGAWLNAFHARWNPIPLAAKGFAVVMPNITGSTGYGQAFVNAISGDWGGRAYEDVLGVLDWAATTKDLDATRACAMGGSYGGYMMNWIEGHTDRFKCLISHAGPSALDTKYGTTDELWFPEWEMGGTPWDKPETYARWSPHTYAKSFKTPMLVIHGARDFRVSLEQALVMFTYLKRQGVEARLMVFPDEDHFVQKPKNRKFWYDSVNLWLKGHLMPR